MGQTGGLRCMYVSCFVKQTEWAAIVEQLAR
jgi:hypothetical protein